MPPLQRNSRSQGLVRSRGGGGAYPLTAVHVPLPWNRTSRGHEECTVNPRQYFCARSRDTYCYCLVLIALLPSSRNCESKSKVGENFFFFCTCMGVKYNTLLYLICLNCKMYVEVFCVGLHPSRAIILVNLT